MGEEKTDQQILTESTVDPACFDEIVSRYYDRLCSYAFKTLGDADLAADVAEEALLRCFERRHRLAQDGRGCRSWLYRVVTNLTMTSCSRRAAERRYILRRGPESLQISGDDGDIQEQTGEALTYCTPAERTLLLLRYAENLSDTEIAQIMNRTPAGVRVALHRALDHLRRLLET